MVLLVCLIDTEKSGGDGIFTDEPPVRSDDETFGEWEEGSNPTVVDAAEHPQVTAGLVVPEGIELQLVSSTGVAADLTGLLRCEKFLKVGVGAMPVFGEASAQDGFGLPLVHRDGASEAGG